MEFNGDKTNASISSARPRQNGSKVASVKRSSRQNSPSTGIPARVRPLLNFVVWRAHNDIEPATARYILLTNDQATQKQAQKFGVRAKLVSQLRNIVLKDGRKLDVGEPLPEETSLESEMLLDDVPIMEADDDAEEILFQPVPRVTQRPNGNPNVLDPNHFGRSPARASRRGNGLPTANVRSTPTRGSVSSPRGRNSVPVGRQPRPTQLVKPIDPDSYIRPAPTLRRGRGGGRRLWEPT